MKSADAKVECHQPSAAAPLSMARMVRDRTAMIMRGSSQGSSTTSLKTSLQVHWASSFYCRLYPSYEGKLLWKQQVGRPPPGEGGLQLQEWRVLRVIMLPGLLDGLLIIERALDYAIHVHGRLMQSTFDIDEHTFRTRSAADMIKIKLLAVLWNTGDCRASVPKCEAGLSGVWRLWAAAEVASRVPESQEAHLFELRYPSWVWLMWRMCSAVQVVQG